MTSRANNLKKSLQAVLATLAFSALATAPASANSRTVESAYGPVEISGQPGRVVTLYEGALDAALAVDANTVGAVITRGGSDVAGYIRAQAGDIAIVGAPAETNIEAVIAAQPDLILAAPRIDKQQVELLSRIAPVIASNVPMLQPDSWEQETRLFAKALGREDQAERVIIQVKDRIAEVAELVSAKIPDGQRDATLVRWMPQGPLVMAEGLFSASLLKAVGFELTDTTWSKRAAHTANP